MYDDRGFYMMSGTASFVKKWYEIVFGFIPINKSYNLSFGEIFKTICVFSLSNINEKNPIIPKV